MTGGIDKLSEQIAERLAADMRSHFDRLGLVVSSPIERLLEMAIYHRVMKFPYDPYAFDYVDTSQRDEGLEQAIARSSARIGNEALLLVRQCRLLDWPADYVVVVLSDPNKFIVVECDGHDFHERTKEQAARDRSRDRRLQAAGHHVLRFTGSEIYRDPMKCAEEVLDRANEIYWKAWSTRNPNISEGTEDV
jgi:very-short-patch-repair endonuclease